VTKYPRKINLYREKFYFCLLALEVSDQIAFKAVLRQYIMTEPHGRGYLFTHSGQEAKKKVTE
jgi:hypothetical protein